LVGLQPKPMASFPHENTVY